MKLTAATRKQIPSSDFALPGGRFPIENQSHARAALSDAHNVSPAQQATIRSKVESKYPQIDAQRPKATADILLRKKKKEPEVPPARPDAMRPATADILNRRKK